MTPSDRRRKIEALRRLIEQQGTPAERAAARLEIVLADGAAEKLSDEMAVLIYREIEYRMYGFSFTAWPLSPTL